MSTNKNGDIDNDGDIDTIYTYGSRSFSIWNGSTGNLVYDSKDDLEMITATNSYSVLLMQAIQIQQEKIEATIRVQSQRVLLLER